MLCPAAEALDPCLISDHVTTEVDSTKRVFAACLEVLLLL